MHSYIIDWCSRYNVPLPGLISSVISIFLIFLFSVVLLFVLHRYILPAAMRVARRTKTDWDEISIRNGVLKYFSWVVVGVLIHRLAMGWLPVSSMEQQLLRLFAQFGIITSAVLLIHAFLDTVHDIYRRFTFARQFPIKIFIQVLKLVIILVALVMALAAVMGRSPVLLVSGLGAMTAILMLIFKDPILGFVAGIQLSANRMLSVGDWLEMPKYNADGDVIDITLTTVKVSNWDRTITTIPTYALISESFKNWRGMTEAGGRRIKRSLYVDMTSVHFLTPDDIERLNRLQLISRYVSNKLEEIEQHNRDNGIDPTSSANGRHLTNLGTFRAYLVAYLQAHPRIRQDMIMIVRQLNPTPQGLPLEVYAFTNDTAWVSYEGIQSDIFDHILAVITEFGLRVFQTPSGSDLMALRT